MTVAAHYYPAWKRGAAGLHNGFDDLHGYPERTPLAGYYDEENPEYCDWEIKWALEHGINCFIYCWYRRKENEGKKVSPSALRCGHGLHEALFHARFQNLMKFAIMFENGNRWGNTDRHDLLENLMPFWLDEYFSRPNYLVLDGKPVLFVCGKAILDGVFDSPSEQRQYFDRCRSMAVRRGFAGLSIAACVWDYGVAKETYLDCTERGYDFHFGYNAGYSPARDLPPEEEIISAQCDLLARRLAVDPLRHTATASCFRDAGPRCTPAWDRLGFSFGKETRYHLSADGFRRVIRRMREMTEALPEGAWGRRIFMIDNWNEWDEGHYVSPSHEFGFRYLEAIREELTLRDNLPDYRMPQDLGLSNFNRSWGEPDLGGVCRERFRLE